MGLFDIFCNVVSGGAAAQDDIDQGGRPNASRWSERQARGWWGAGEHDQGAIWFGYAGRAARDEVSRNGRRSWFF